jgi:fermentation-respiration switch protein FrsA (DUF1100 family)
MPKFLKSKRFWVIFSVSIVVLCIVGWVGVSTAIYFLAPKLTFDTASSKNLDYGIAYTTIIRPDKEGDQIEILSVDSTNPNGSNLPVIVYFSGNVGRRPYIIQDASKIGRVISPAYPGFSGSTGQPTSDNVYETVDVTMQYLLNIGYKQSDIIVLGHSLGGAAAMYAAKNYPDLQKVVIVNTFYSMEAMCQTRYSIFCTFGYNFLNTSTIAPEAKAKIQMFCNSNDDYVPHKQCTDLYNIVGSKDKQLFDISGTHDIFPVATALTTN